MKRIGQRLRLLIAIDSFYDGGAEMFAIRLANHLVGDADVFFFVYRPWLTEDNRQKSLLDERGVSLIERTGSPFLDLLVKILFRLSRIRGLGPVKKWTMYWQLVYVCWRYRIQVVNSHCWETDSAFARVKDRCRFSLVSTFHGHYELPQESEDRFEKESRYQLQRIDAVVYLSPNHLSTLDRFGVPVERRFKIFNGISYPVETEITRYEPGERLRLVMAARGIREKGWAETLVAVVEINHELGDVVTIDLLGTGEILDELRSKYTGCSYIRFLGYHDDILPYIKKVHIGLLPSYYRAESLPNTIVEYLVCGKPVITTNVGAIREMITCGSELAGKILPVENYEPVSSEHIKNALLEYINNPGKVSSDSKVALCAARKFHMRECVESYLRLYGNLCPTVAV